MLVDQLVGRTGDWELANAVRGVLTGLMGGAAGLPQGFRPMRLLGDVYISQCVRALRRGGYGAWSHSDDMRIACGSEREAHECVVVLDGALREAGLSLNSEKCWAMPQERYAEWTARPQQLLAQFAEGHQLAVSLWDLAGPYDEDESEHVPTEEPSEEDIQGTVRQIFDWIATKERTTGGALAWSDRVVITEALRKGAAYPEAHGLSVLPAIIAEFPQLTDEVAQYIRAVHDIDEEAATAAIGAICAPRRAVSPWQLSWLAWAALGMEDVPRRMRTRCAAAHAEMSLGVPWAWCSALLLHLDEVEASELAAVLDRVESAVGRDVIIEALVSSDVEVKESLAEAAHERAIIAAGRD